ALALAPEPEARARYAYNAGTVAARAGRFDAALPLLRRALVLTPGDEAARFNYEFVKRRLQQEQEGSEGGTPPEPSAFARALKARADRLVAARRYADALALLQDGLTRDSTVAAFGDYLQRLQTVVEIEQLAAPAPDSL
ncbi:MAG TPA: hypothetical protein VD962_13465, partial [Rubricoccaceae bacterium]|nr:hypothetical protein [Rubricoccaceae bacterium]